MSNWFSIQGGRRWRCRGGGVGLGLVMLLGLGRLSAQDWARANYEAPAVAEVAPAAAGAAVGGGALTSGGLHAASPGLNRPAGKVGRTANVGPLALSLGVFGSLEYNDNVRVEPAARDGLIATGGLRFDTSYQVTQLQELSLQGAISNRVPLTGPGRREQLFSVAPDSALRFNVWVGSLRLSPFIKYQRQLDPVLSPVVNGTEILDQATFTTGLQADLPLNEATLQVLVLRERRSQQGDQTLAQTIWSRVGSVRLVRRSSATNTWTADVAWVDARLDNGPSGETESLSAAIYDDWRLSSFITVQLGGGVARSRYRASRVVGDVAENTSPFFTVSLDHRLRENLSYVLHFQRMNERGVSTNYYRLSELALTPKYKFTKMLTVESTAAWQWIQESGPTGETATRWSVGGALGYVVAVNLDLRLNVDRVVKHSSQSLREYGQNRIGLSANYQF